MHNALVDANNDLVEVPDVSVIETPAGDFPNATSPIAILGQILQAGPDAPPAVLAAAQAAGVGPDLKVSADANVTPLYAALLEAAPDQAGRVIHFEGDELDALLWDITTTAGEDVAELRVGLDEAFAPVNELGASAIDTSQNIIGDVVVTELTNSQSNSLFLTILAAGKEMKKLGMVEFPAPLMASPVAANGQLIVTTMTHLYCFAQGAKPVVKND